jgi:hypothetical protein
VWDERLLLSIESLLKLTSLSGLAEQLGEVEGDGGRDELVAIRILSNDPTLGNKSLKKQIRTVNFFFHFFFRSPLTNLYPFLFSQNL